MRGLKLSAQQWRAFGVYVASFTDAWIETPIWVLTKMMLLSHLLQMRGLKQQDQKYDDAQRMSHLLQMRGLKL